MSSGGGTFLKFRVGRAPRAGAFARYVSRESAVLDGRSGVLTRGLPEFVTRSEDYLELQTNLVAYATTRAEIEGLNPYGGGRTRSHYELTFAFERDVTTDKAREMINEWFERALPNARSAAFIHRDTDHVHAHCWVDTRQTNDKKIDLRHRSYRSLDEVWNEIYSRELSLDVHEHLDKKRETMLHKQLYHRARETGDDRELALIRAEKPQRSMRKSRADFSKAEREQAGIYELNQTGTTRDQSTTASRHAPSAGGERSTSHGERVLNEFADQCDRTESAARSALQEAAGVADRTDRSGYERGGR